MDGAEWRIPAELMKMGELHIAPLARRAVAILRELKALASFGEYVFPSLLALTRPMLNNTVKHCTSSSRLHKGTDDRSWVWQHGEHAAQ